MYLLSFSIALNSPPLALSAALSTASSISAFLHSISLLKLSDPNPPVTPPMSTSRQGGSAAAAAAAAAGAAGDGSCEGGETPPGVNTFGEGGRPDSGSPGSDGDGDGDGKGRRDEDGDGDEDGGVGGDRRERSHRALCTWRLAIGTCSYVSA